MVENSDFSSPFLPVFPLIIRYPFLKFSGIFLEHLYGSFENILDNSDNLVVKEAMERAKNEIKAVIENKKLESDSKYESFLCIRCDIKCYSSCDKFMSSECILCSECFEKCRLSLSREYYNERVKNARISAISYLYSRILLSNLDDWVLRRYAIRKSDAISELLSREPYEVLKIVASDLGVGAEFLNSTVKVHVTTFLKVSVRMRAKEWRLINRSVRKGMVDLSRDDFERVIKEFLRERLSTKQHEFMADSIKKYDFILRDIDELRILARSVRKTMPKLSIEKINTSQFPPCMRRILSDLQAGVNLPHTARFAITSFLLNLGMDVEEIISLYRMAPDFDEEKTRYQVEHIAGAKGTEYHPPACDTMKTYHNCYADDSCRGIYHPLDYYLKRQERSEKKR
jgi:DNA primase large subunit